MAMWLVDGAPGLVWKGVTSEKHVVPAWWAICLIKRPLSQSIRLSAREPCAACPQSSSHAALWVTASARALDRGYVGVCVCCACKMQGFVQCCALIRVIWGISVLLHNHGLVYLSLMDQTENLKCTHTVNQLFVNYGVDKLWLSFSFMLSCSLIQFHINSTHLKLYCNPLGLDVH